MCWVSARPPPPHGIRGRGEVMAMENVDKTEVVGMMAVEVVVATMAERGGSDSDGGRMMTEQR